MAKGTIARGHGAYGKDEQTRKNEDKLSKKLQADLESALLRLFENSVYCDVELIVESDSILTHSCILQARVARFYNFLVTECQVLRKNGFSSIAIYNVSFISLRKFVENVYRNVEISEVEEYMLRHLLERKTKKNASDYCEVGRSCKGAVDSLLLKAPKSQSQIELTPDADLFYTPKCSPSEIQKSFVQSRSESPVKIKDNDITCYYKIVSVDDIHIGEVEKGERVADKPSSISINNNNNNNNININNYNNNNNDDDNNNDEGSLKEDEHLEKELAEQDELFLSFKSIFSKVSKAKPSGCPVSNAAGHNRVAKRKEAPKPAKKHQSNLLSVDDCKRTKAKLPLWRPNPLTRDVAENHFDKHASPKTNFRNNSADPLSIRRKLDLDPAAAAAPTTTAAAAAAAAISHETRNCHTEMDMSATGADSGLETSSSCQPEASPRENTTASETSGLDLTDAAINEDIPHDEETVSTKPAESVEDSSASSDVGTWDANDESRSGGDHGKGFESSVIECPDDPDNRSREDGGEDKDGTGFCREALNAEEIARLDAMERNIKECETFIDRERQIFYCCDNDPSPFASRDGRVSESNANPGAEPTSMNTDDARRVEGDNNNVDVAENEGNYLYNGELCNNMEASLTRDLSSDVTCRNLINNEIERDDYSVSECNSNEFFEAKDEGLSNKSFGFLPRRDCDSVAFVASPSDAFRRTKTPPCSPRRGPADDEKNSSVDAKSDDRVARSAVPPVVSNYFIDASSLLDEDEIISRTASLVAFKGNDAERGKEAACDVEEISMCDNMQFIQDEERRQGELLFKASIPHFSRHEIEEPDEAMERSLREDDCAKDDGEQVVPSSDIRLDRSSCSLDGDDVHIANSYATFSLPNALPPEPSSDREEMMVDDEPFDRGERDAADGVPKKLDAESLPIVSGGAAPEDFSGPPSQISSPRVRRRNESAPIVSGGMDYVEEDRKTERRANASQGEAWIVSFEDEKPRRRRQTITSESDLESLELGCDSQNGDKSPATLFGDACSGGLKEVRLDNSQVVNCRNLNNAKEASGSQRSSNSIEKSASLGYFIEFSKDEEEPVAAAATATATAQATEADDEERSRSKQNAKKNMFSMFIDMSCDDSQATDSVPCFERQGTWENEPGEEAVKKPFYMFIESDSPATKRKTNQSQPQKKLLKSSDGTAEERRQVASERKSSEPGKRPAGHGPSSNERSSPASSNGFNGSSLSLFEAGAETRATPQIRVSKLPLPLSKSSSLSSVNGDAKMVVWSENKDRRSESVSSGETWLKTNDVQITYKGRKGENAGEEEEEEVSVGDDAATLRKGSTFVIADDSAGSFRKRDAGRRASEGRSGGPHLRTVDEVRSPFKSPEERDSGVIVTTEESDDSFVKLSDMDNYRNPYLESGTKKAATGSGIMSRSIPESKWAAVATTEGKASAKLGDGGDRIMSKSIGSGTVKPSSGFATDKQVSRSLSRLFPNLNLSAIHGRRNINNNNNNNNSGNSPGGARQQDTDPSDTQASEVSELSSMQSSVVDPSAMEMSTSETDTSCHNGGTSRLGEDLLRMFLEEISTDVVVEVGGRRMKAHKCILSSRCQYFAAMLSGGWVESAGNVISLQGFSYNSVHFALCHIYSGENRIPDSLNIIELATLADMLCLEGLKEVISHTLKVKYCHCFHLPCDECHVGVLDCLPVAAAYGLDDLYRKCLRWITKHFVRVWPSKTFASLPKELLDKCYQHHVVHMTVENVLDTILNIDKVRGSLPNVRWSETVSRLVTKLHDSAVKYIADHFSSILTSDNFLALGKEASWSVGRLEDSLLEATKRLPPEQACWSHARLHRILTVAKGPDPPSEMDWNGNFIDLLQCISGHVENSLIKQAPRAAKSKAWRQLEPELRSRIQERACLVLPDDALSPKGKRTSCAKRESRPNSISAASRANSRNLEIRHMKIAMTQQVTRNASMGRIQHADSSRPAAKEPRSSRTLASASVARKPEITVASGKKTAGGAPEVRKLTSSRFMDVKPRYLEPKSPQKGLSDKPSSVSNFRRTMKPLSSSDSSRNCSPLNANVRGKAGGVANSRQHRDSIASTESTASYDGRKDRSYVSARSDTPSAKTPSRSTADENVSTDSLFTDSLRSEKEATTRASRADESRATKGKENVRKSVVARSVVAANSGAVAKSTATGHHSPSARKLISDNSTAPPTAAYRSSQASKKLTASASETKVTPPKRFSAARIGNVNQRASPGRSSLASPRNATNSRNVLQRNATKYDANVINGNTVKKNRDVDSENNMNSVKDDKRPSTVSRSGTFLKDEPTILKKPQAENIESSF